jgi:hypothetical protein
MSANHDLPHEWNFGALEADALANDADMRSVELAGAAPRRAYLHTPISPDQFANTLSRALADAERASLAAAESARVRGAIAQREVAPGVWQLKQGRAS